MIVASRKTVGKRLLPLLLAMVFLLLSLPESAFAASVSAVVTADAMAVYADPDLSQQVGTLAEGEVVASLVSLTLQAQKVSATTRTRTRSNAFFMVTL